MTLINFFIINIKKLINVIQYYLRNKCYNKVIWENFICIQWILVVWLRGSGYQSESVHRIRRALFRRHRHHGRRKLEWRTAPAGVRHPRRHPEGHHLYRLRLCLNGYLDRRHLRPHVALPRLQLYVRGRQECLRNLRRRRHHLDRQYQWYVGRVQALASHGRRWHSSVALWSS